MTTPNSRDMPGFGDEITWGAVWHPNDPRAPEPPNDEDLDAFADRLIDEAANLKAFYKAGNLAGAEATLRDLKLLIEDC